MSSFNINRPILFIVFVVGFFFAFGFVAQWLHQDMLLWRAVAPVVRQDAAHQLQSALFNFYRQKQPVPVLAIGDELFLKALRRRYLSKTATEIRVSVMHLPSLTEFFNELPIGAVHKIILQQSPLHWSNAAFRHGRQRYDYWNAFKGEGYRIYPLNDVRLLFKAFLDLATANENWKSSDQSRTTNLDEFRFRKDRTELDDLRRALSRHSKAGAQIVWILDLRVYDLNSNALLIKDILDRFAVLADENSFIEYRVIDEDCLKREACP